MYLQRNVGSLIEPLTGRSWTRSDIMERLAGRAAYYAAAGLNRHDRVFLHYGNTLEFFVDLLAIWAMGGCAVPVDGRLTSFEVGKLAEAARPRFSVWNQPPDQEVSSILGRSDVSVVDLESVDWAAPADTLTSRTTGLHLDDEALILFTSGTTGQPKGVVHTHRSLRARWMSLHHALGTQSFQRTLCLLPTHFGHGLICNCLFPWLSGQDLHILPPFRADLLLELGTLIDRHKITFMSSVPPVWRLALKMAKPPTAATLQRVFCGSAPLSETLWKSIQEWTGTRNVLNSYGITETGSWLAGTTIPELTPEDGLIGNAWGGVLRVLPTGTTDVPPWDVDSCATGESGFVWINTPALMKGYMGRDDLTRQVVSHGWFVTGDIGLIDDRGYLYLRGREREEINKGGTKIYPSDIDSVAERFEGMRDVCTFAYADPLHGENVGIAMVLDSAGDDELLRLHDWMKQHLAKHQLPDRWYVVDEIPRTSRGKINRVSVSESCQGLPQTKLKSLLRKRRG